MPTYLMLTTLTEKGVQTLKSNPGRLREVNRDVEELGARVLHQWVSLGEYDFVNIVEAPDDLTIAKVSVALGARGSAKLESLPLVPIDDFLAALEGVGIAPAALQPPRGGDPATTTATRRGTTWVTSASGPHIGAAHARRDDLRAAVRSEHLPVPLRVRQRGVAAGPRRHSRRFATPRAKTRCVRATSSASPSARTARTS